MVSVNDERYDIGVIPIRDNEYFLLLPRRALKNGKVLSFENQRSESLHREPSFGNELAVLFVIPNDLHGIIMLHCLPFVNMSFGISISATSRMGVGMLRGDT